MQQQTIKLRAVDIGNAIIEQEMALQASHTYLAAILKHALDKKVSIPKEIFESLQNEQWEVSTSASDTGINFELVDGRELVNKRLGRTAGGLVVPNS